MTHPRLLAEAGIQSLYILNVNPKERELRSQKKELQFLWRPFYQHLGRRAEIFTHILYDYQVSPLSLHISDSSTSTGLDPSQPSLHSYLQEMSKHYDSKHLLMMVGSGLNFEKAEFYL